MTLRTANASSGSGSAAERRTRRLSGDPPTTEAGLADRYRAWCRSVPFDNALRWLALHGGVDGVADIDELPGRRLADFWRDHRRFGTGGMCVATAQALCANLRSDGYAARLVLASIDGASEPDHVTTLVTVAGRDYVVDTVALTERPIPLDEASTEFGDGLGAVSSRRSDDGWELTWRTPVHGTLQRCVVRPDQPLINASAFYRRTQQSPTFQRFNQTLYARRTLGNGDIAVVIGPFAIIARGDGTTRSAESAAGALRQHFCWPAAFVHRLHDAGAFA